MELPPEVHNVHPVYRPDIDGLRALAILSVVIFHAFPFSLPGGFVGVDVFFVISGFLISTIIFRSLQRGDFSFAEFYAHRIKRIFPALIIVLMGCYAFGWFALLPDEFKQLGKHMAAGAGFVSNYILWKEAGYFDTTAELKPLLHLWSLAIEEQFYLIYPVLIFIAWRIGLNVLTVILSLGLVSFGLNISWVAINPAQTFFMPQTRFWELLAGSVLAYLQFFKQAKLAAWMRRWMFHPVLFRQPPAVMKRDVILNDLISVVGLGLIIIALFFVTKSKSFPGWWATLPVTGAFLLILAGGAALVNHFVLANRLMVFVGMISYPLYLWHWPLLSFARIVESGIPSREIRVGAVILSFMLASLTYFLVEKPIRFGRRTWVKTAILMVLLTIVGSVGYNAFRRNGLAFRVKEFQRVSEQILKAAGEWDYPGKLLTKNLDGIQYFYRPSERQAVTLFVGDSNIEQYWPRVERLIEDGPKRTNGAIFKTGGSCIPIPELPFNTQYSYCASLTEDAIRIMQARPEVDTVVIGAKWTGLTAGWSMTRGFNPDTDGYRKALRDLGDYVRRIQALGKRVFLILDIPAGPKFDPKFMLHRDLKFFPKVLSIRSGGEPKAQLDKLAGQLNADLGKIGVDAGASVIKPIDFLCDLQCPGTDANNFPIYKDMSHLRPAYVRKYAEFIDATVR